MSDGILCADYAWRDWRDLEERDWVDEDGAAHHDDLGRPHHEYMAVSIPTHLPQSPVSLAVAGSRCPPGRERMTQFGVEELARAQGYLGPGEILCVAITACRYDQDGQGEDPRCKDKGTRPAWGLGYVLTHGHAQFQRLNGALVSYDAGRGWSEGWARFYHERQGGAAPYTHPVYLDAAWSWSRFRLTDCSAAPAPATPTPAGPPPTPMPSGTCPPLLEVEWDVLRIALKSDRQNAGRAGTESDPAIADEDIIIGHVTPKMGRPWCPNDRVICELGMGMPDAEKDRCQDEAVGFPLVTQTLPGAFANDKVVHNSSNKWITFQNLAPGETGRFEMTACTERGTHCTTSYVWVR